MQCTIIEHIAGILVITQNNQEEISPSSQCFDLPFQHRPPKCPALPDETFRESAESYDVTNGGTLLTFEVQHILKVHLQRCAQP